MTGEERKKLRDGIMQEVYDHYFKNSGAPLRLSKEKLNSDMERKLGIDYLIDKDLLKEERMGMDNLMISPTPYGIDYVEKK